MPFAADLHIHSPYARAVSKEMVPEEIYRWAQLKGIRVVGTGDFTHPRWFAELQEKLQPAEPGLFRLRPELAAGVDETIPERCRSEVRFMLTGEISSIYKRHERTRKVHNLIFAPDFVSVAKLSARLGKIGNIESDGRPILGLDSERLLGLMLETIPDGLFVPAHAWTPHFSVFGANSGFDSLQECFGELTPHIKAIETGLSSDPPMNWRLSQLEGITLISNSDAHSPSKLGREANLLETELSYRGIVEAISSGDSSRFLGTIEFFPEEGKYHYDGHRNCGVRLSPSETVANEYCCPQCSKPVTVGVMHRVEVLADRPEGHRPEHAPAHTNLVPLEELISEILGVGVNSKKVRGCYFKLLDLLGNEFTILMETPIHDIEQCGEPLLAEAIKRMRQGKVRMAAGYDGEYGTLQLFDPEERALLLGQLSLF